MITTPSKDNINQVNEATFTDIRRKQKTITNLFPSFYTRVQKVGSMGGVHLYDVNEDLWYFRVHSGTQSDVWYNIVVYFKEVKQILQKLVKDRRLWLPGKTQIDYRKAAIAFLENVDVQLSCSCLAQIYYGGDYILSQDRYDAKHGKKEKRPPRVRNPKEFGAHCKHLEAVFKVLPFYQQTAAKWLRDFYSDEIQQIELQAAEELKGFKKAAAQLKARGEEVRKKQEEEKPSEKEASKPVSKEQEKAPEKEAPKPVSKEEETEEESSSKTSK